MVGPLLRVLSMRSLSRDERVSALPRDHRVMSVSRDQSMGSLSRVQRWDFPRDQRVG